VHFQLHRIQYVNFLGVSFASATEKLILELKSKGIDPAPVITEAAPATTPNVAIAARRQWIVFAAVGILLGVVILVFGMMSVFSNINSVPATPTIEFLYAPIRDEAQLETSVPYEVTLSEIFSGAPMTGAISFDVMGMDSIDGTISFMIPESATIEALVSGEVPISENIPIALDASLGFQDQADEDTITVIARLDADDSVLIYMNFPLSLETVAIVQDPIPLTTITTLHLNDGTSIDGTLDLTFPAGLEIPLNIDLDIPVESELQITMNVSSTSQVARDRVPPSIQVFDSMPLDFTVSIDSETTAVLTQAVPFVVFARFAPDDGSSTLQGTVSLTLPAMMEFTVQASGTGEVMTDVPIAITIPTDPDTLLPVPSPPGFDG